MTNTVKSTVQQQMKDALKAGEKQRLAVLRMILNEINATQVNDPNADELACVRAYHRKLAKARPEFEKVGATDRLAEIDREMAIVEEFLPTAMSDDELERLIEQMIIDHGYTQRDFGRAMKDILAQAGGRADGGRVSAILKAKLAAHS